VIYDDVLWRWIEPARLRGEHEPERRLEAYKPSLHAQAFREVKPNTTMRSERMSAVAVEVLARFCGFDCLSAHRSHVRAAI
jgi:hypothetical protein